LAFAKRKHPRLKNYDYSQNGCYYVTICTKNHYCILGQIPVGWDAHIPPTVELSDIGKIAKKYIENINCVYDVSVDNYVIMPNHIHLLISISAEKSGGLWAARPTAANPTLHTIIRSFKTMVTKQIGYSVWQDSYFDRIIRDEKGYREVWQYIDENPVKWVEDQYYYSR